MVECNLSFWTTLAFEIDKQNQILRNWWKYGGYPKSKQCKIKFISYMHTHVWFTFIMMIDWFIYWHEWINDKVQGHSTSSVVKLPRINENIVPLKINAPIPVSVGKIFVGSMPAI